MIALALDSSVVCTLLLQERGWQAIQRTVQRDDIAAIMPGPVLTEAIAVTRRKGNRSTAVQIHEALSALGLHVEHPTDADLVRAAELLEVSTAHPAPSSGAGEATLSLGDALILAVTERLGYLVLTRDTYGKWMVDRDLVRVRVAIP